MAYSLVARTRAAVSTLRCRSKNSVLSPFIASLIVHGPPQKFKMENPFQRSGPANMIEVNDLERGTLVRVAVPGVAPDGFKAWKEKNTVFFVGKGEVEFEGEKSGRTYGVSLDFCPELYRADGFSAEVANGVLRLLVPFVDGGEK